MIVPFFIFPFILSPSLLPSSPPSLTLSLSLSPFPHFSSLACLHISLSLPISLQVYEIIAGTVENMTQLLAEQHVT